MAGRDGVILLDTHALVWWLGGTQRLTPQVVALMAESPPAAVSPVSFWELAMLVETGRVEVDRDLVRWARDVLLEGGLELAQLTPSAAISAARLPAFHGDRADRFIYATARELGVPLASKDQRLRSYAARHHDVQVVW